jgi:hypothetical protein
MITGREYYLYCFGAMTTIDLPHNMKYQILEKMGKGAGLEVEEMRTIIKEIEETLKWKLVKDVSNFGID